MTITAAGDNDIDVECTTSTFHGDVTDGSSEATFTASYSGTINIVNPHTAYCSSDLGALTVNMNGCDYVLTGNTTQMDPTADAVIWVVCPTGKEIKISVPALGVTLEIPAQTPTEGGVRYTNEAGGKVKIDVTVTGITYTCTPTFLCGLGGVSSEGDNSDYTGTVVAHGKNGSPDVSVGHVSS